MLSTELFSIILGSPSPLDTNPRRVANKALTAHTRPDGDISVTVAQMSIPLPPSQRNPTSLTFETVLFLNIESVTAMSRPVVCPVVQVAVFYGDMVKI